MAKIFKPKIVSANDLLDGDVVYLDVRHNWTRKIAKAAVAHSSDTADELLVFANQPAKVVGPYLLDVTLGDDGLRPDHFRERFRETGSTLDARFARPDRSKLPADDAATQGTL